jgi:hypothetical protein
MKTNIQINSDPSIPVHVREKLFSYETLMKKLFYACEKCDGALIQLATCVVCKRTSMRICVNCATVSKTPHESCNIVRVANHSSTILEVDR